MIQLPRATATALLWSSVELSGRYVTHFVVTLLLARALGPADFGLVAMVLFFTGVGSVLVDAGLGATLIRRVKTSAKEEASAFTFSVLTALVLVIILYFVAPSVADFYGDPRITTLLRVMSVVLLVSGLVGVPEALLVQQMAFRLRARIEVVAYVLAGVAALVLASRGAGYWSLAAYIVAAPTFRCVGLYATVRWRPRVWAVPAALFELLRFGGAIAAGNLLDIAYVRLHALVIGHHFSSTQVGFYSLAQEVQQAPTSLLAAVLNRVGLTTLSRLEHDPARLAEAARRAMVASSFVFVPMMVALASLATPVMRFAFGSQWVEAAPVLSVLALAAALWPLHVINVVAIMAAGRSGLLLGMEMLKKAIAVPLLLLSAPYGILMVAYSILASSLASAVIGTRAVRKVTGASGQWAALLPISLATAFSFGAGWFAWRLVGNGGTAYVAGVLVGSSLYLPLAIAFGSDGLRQLHHLVRLLRPERLPEKT